MKKRKILILCDYSSVYGGNFIASIRQLSFAIHNKGYSLFLCFPKKSKLSKWSSWLESDFEVIYFDPNNKRKNVASIIKKNNISIVYTHFFGLCFISYLQLRFPFLKIVSHIHSDFSNGKNVKPPLLKRCLLSLFTTKVKFVVVSENIAGLPHKKHQYYVRNALCLDREFDRDSEPLSRKQLGIKQEDIVFEVFGWSPITKGVDIAINAINHASEKVGLNLKLLLITDEGNKTQTFANELGISLEHVVFVRPIRDVFQIHDISDVFVSCSRSEGFSYAALEALFCNVPVVFSDIPGTSWLNDYDRTYSFKTEQFLSLSDVMVKLSTIISKKEQKRNDLILSDFNITVWCNKITELLVK